MTKSTPRASAWFSAIAALCLIFACHLETAPETQETFSFPTLKDKIGDANHVLIQIKDSTGKLVDVLFEGPVDSTTRFEDLTAPNYSGGKVYIHIEATRNGETLYKVQRGYDPAQGGDIAQETIVIVDPTKIPKDTIPIVIVPKDTTAQPRLRLQPDTLVLALRGPTGRFTVEFPAASSAGPVLWSALDPGAEVAMDGLVNPKAQGFSRVVAANQTNAADKDTAWVKVLPVQPVDSIRFEKRPGALLLLGASESLAVRVHPPLAPQGIALSIRDTGIVRLSGGTLQAIAEGETRVYVHSLENPLRRDSLAVTVLSPKLVDSVRLQEDTLKLYVKGEGASLTPKIYPADLQGLYLWKSENPAVATVSADGRVTPVSQGQTQVVVRAWADSTKRDQVILLVKKDTPRILAGSDTIVVRGTALVHNPAVTQEYGQVAMFKWDLDGNGIYEDSATAVRTGLSFVYAEAKEYAVRFYARDGEGNDTVQIRRVKAVSGRAVQIVSPKDGSFTNLGSVTVSWTVDGVSQSSVETLKSGVNIVTRSSRDSAGNEYTHSITVTLDQVAPNKPLVKGPSVPANIPTPRWSWASTDTSGNGVFRFRLDNTDLNAAPSVTDTEYVAASGLAGGVHTLYVQERDEAGNWSQSGSFAVHIDITAPAAPTVQVQPTSPTNETRPTWTWSGGPGDALRFYRFKLDDGDFRTGARDTLATGFRPTAALSEGVHTLYVQARDSAGNWSPSGSAAVRIDITPPTAPTVRARTRRPMTAGRPGPGPAGPGMPCASTDTNWITMPPGIPSERDSGRLPGCPRACIP